MTAKKPEWKTNGISIWENTSKEGTQYLSVQIFDWKPAIKVFRNRAITEDSQPNASQPVQTNQTPQVGQKYNADSFIR